MPKEALDFKEDDVEKYHLWDHILLNEVNSSLKKAKQAYEQMKIKNVIVIFNSLLQIKESYVIAKEGEKNPYLVARFVEAILTIMNPICPHFCQFAW